MSVIVYSGLLKTQVETFGERVRARRIEFRVSQEVLARRLREAGVDGATQVMVSRIELGTRDLKLFEALMLDAILGMNDPIFAFHWGQS